MPIGRTIGGWESQRPTSVRIVRGWRASALVVYQPPQTTARTAPQAKAWRTDGRRRTVDGGRRTVDGGRRTVDGGRWVVDRRHWKMGDGRRAVCESPSTVLRLPSALRIIRR